MSNTRGKRLTGIELVKETKIYKITIIYLRLKKWVTAEYLTTIHLSVGGQWWPVVASGGQWWPVVASGGQRLGKYPPLATDTGVNSCFSVY